MVTWERVLDTSTNRRGREAEEDLRVRPAIKVINMITGGGWKQIRSGIPPILRLAVSVGVFLVVSVMTVSSTRGRSTTRHQTQPTTGPPAAYRSSTTPVSAMFSATNMAPDDVIINCIVVTYQGSLVPAGVSVYGTSGGGLDAYLDLRIEEGTGAGYGDCTGFSASSTVFNNTLANLAATRTNFGNGITAWSPAVNPESLTYRFTLTLQDTNLAQGLSTTGTFTWEAQNQ